MKKLLYTSTWFMIWLVLMLPVCFAQQLTVQKFSGVDNVNGFVKEGDELTIQILAQMTGNPTNDVARQRARVFYEDTYYFMNSCSAQQSGMYQCNYKTTDLIYAGKDQYTIKLFDAENKEIASVQKNLTVDTLAPRILVFSVSPNMSMTPKPTTIAYKIEDYGSDAGKAVDCSGIKFLNITSNKTQIALIPFNISTCSKNGSFVFTPSITGNNGRLKICAVAVDYLNHKSIPMCRDIIIDARKPTPEALELRDTDGYPITHAKTGQTVVADVSVKISDIDVNPNAVYADLSKLNPTLGRKLKDTKAGDWFIWRNVAVTTPKTCQVTVNATDMLGNKETKTLTCSIGIDDTAPEPLSLSTQFVDDDGNALLGVNGTIVAEFKETGSGMGKGYAFLDLRQLGLGSESKADSCEKSGTENWKCYWNVKPTVATGKYLVKLLPTTRDNLNNQVTKTPQLNVTFDKTIPEKVRLVEIAAFRGNQRVKTNVTANGETIEFVVEGAGFKTAVADLRDLGGEKETPAERCEGNVTKTCVFSVIVGVSGPQPTNVTFNFADSAGNKASLSTSELFILGINNETAPNYWTISAQCSPEMLDRQTLSVFEHPVYCRLKMSSTNSKAEPITVQGPDDFYTECTGAMEYISDMSIENNYAKSTEPFIALSLVSTDYTINNLSFSCPLKTLTRVGNFMAQNFETDNATVNLQFYNLPLGELYNNIDDDVKDVEDSINGVWKVIGQLQTFIGYAEKLCSILNMIMNVISILSAVSLVLDVVGEVLEKIPFTTGAGKSLKEGSKSLCDVSENSREWVNKEGGLLGTINKFCDFITCRAGLFDLVGGKKDVQKYSTDQYMEFISLGDDWTKSQLQGSIGGEGGAQNPSVYLNIKDSLVMSIIVPPLCIPGIIYNLDKWRQIQCRYGLCLLEDVRQNGMPVSVCKDQKSYMQCRFVVGEIFNLIPFAPLLNYWINTLQNIISDPLVLLATIANFVFNCQEACDMGEGINYAVCAGLSIASELGHTVNTIKSFKSVADFGSVSAQWCEDFKDAKDDYESETNA